MKFRNKQIKMSTKKLIAGYLFVSPFILGFLAFYLKPIYEAVELSFNSIQLMSDGYVLEFVGWENYRRALFVDERFIRHLVGSVRSTITNFPLILIFSFFIANMLNQKFRGRTIARAIFFLPVIMTSGVILSLEMGDTLVGMMQGAIKDDTGAFSTAQLGDMLEQTHIPAQITTYITGAVGMLYQVIIASGVQILIFLAGLQTIPPSLYEASSIEGATGWENFWKITFPMISPLILVNSVYTIINSFVGESNWVMRIIHETIFRNLRYGLGSAMAIFYFIVVAVILALVSLLISRKVFYHE